MIKKIEKLLVANRGEIALRVMRTAKEMGISTVAVYSEADRQSPHVQFADEAFCLGPAPSNQSYLLGDKIIAICLENNVTAIHPGYGFLSENAAFAAAVNQAGLILVGPSPEAMHKMGNKIAAKTTVKDYNIPMVPGTQGAIADLQEAIAVAEKIGFPLLIKAAAGGGGKGMRLVEDKETLEINLNRAINEALSAFGDGSVFIERYVTKPRHIEIQILSDNYGNCVYLFERECSIQRRHQKLVEEAPSAFLSDEVRQAMGEAAVKVAKACGYSGAGTVEFLCDEHQNFYFLEMNTRLQVEHTVTEMITGLDLVKEQILIAEGHPLSFKQSDLSINGHAIELRVCAEDPLNNFLPDTGKLLVYKRPQGNGVRVDDGFEEGMTIPVHYDSMIAKLIVHAQDRASAIDKMKRAIDDYHITGVKNTLNFGKYVMNHNRFITAQIDTNFIDNYFSADQIIETISNKELEALALISLEIINNNNLNASKINDDPSQNTSNNWRRLRTL